VRAARPTLLVCANHPDTAGELTRVDPASLCRNFRYRRDRPVRLTPPEPPNDQVRYIALTRGMFALVDAARACDRKARQLFGQFAYLNFPDQT
jgi:hypothetical protein